MAQVKDIVTPEEELLQLYELQKIHSKIDEIRVLQGELPDEVQDLEDEMAGLETRISNLETELNQLNTQITNYNITIENAETLIAKYEKQQMNVKNNREFDAISKEIEMQHLDIELAKKRTRDTLRDIETKKQYLQESQKRRDVKRRELDNKKKELEVIITETAKEEQELVHKAAEQMGHIKERLLAAYNRIRNTYRNGLAVVPIERDSCGGCFGKIPPQKQIEIAQHKKIHLCEHCGRILVSPYIDPEYGDVEHDEELL
ncbi:MAG: hypothetical protein JNM36_05760 [Chitinophagales bacterium]|nr:hypothetical protein [Chitinophagales bacterium]